MESNNNMVGEEISLENAISWTTTYQKANPDGVRSVFFSADIFRKLLDQAGATGIRIYKATNSDQQECFVLVGATEDSDLTGEGFKVFDKGRICPPDCVENILNRG